MSSQLTPLLLLVVLLVVFWLVVLRPARTQQRNQQSLQRSLEVGEDVVLSSGIFGTVTDLDDVQVGLEIAPGTVIRVARQVVVRRVDDTAREAGTTQPVDEETERPAIFADESPETTRAAEAPETAEVVHASEHPTTTDPEIAPHEVPETEVTTGSAPATTSLEEPEHDPATEDPDKGAPARKTAAKKATKASKKAGAKKAATKKTTAAGATSTGPTAAAEQPARAEQPDGQTDGQSERG